MAASVELSGVDRSNRFLVAATGKVASWIFRRSIENENPAGQ